MFDKIREKLIQKKDEVKNFINKDVTVILDNGHGKNTAGKHSPKWSDGTQLFEWEFNRDIVKRIQRGLALSGIKYQILVPEDTDISLTERCRRANKIYKDTKKRCFGVSVHANAGKGTGWEVWTSAGKTKSDDIATIFWNEMKSEFPKSIMRLDTSDGDVDKEKNFTIIYDTDCPFILTENFFMDYEPDCRLIMSESGRQKIANAHIRAIKKTIMNLY